MDFRKNTDGVKLTPFAITSIEVTDRENVAGS
jgi:hypothetical protein